MNHIFDTHAHYSSRQFDADRAALLKALPEGGVVGVLECATHSGDAQKVLELAHTAPYFHAALGIHPESLIEEDAATVAVYHGDWRAELAAMRPLFEDKAVVAVGEIGLDHHWPVPREEQYALFEAQLQLARELDLPVSVHDREAHAEMYDLLRKYKPRGALHCYSGSADDAAWLVEQGMYLGFGGAVTYKGAKRAARVLAAIPHDRALLETDCPYMAPEPVREPEPERRDYPEYSDYDAPPIPGDELDPAQFAEEQPEDSFLRGRETAKPEPPRTPERAPVSAPAPAASDGKLWSAVCAAVMDKMPFDVRGYLVDESKVCAAVDGDVLRVEVVPGFVYGRVNKPDIIQRFSDAARSISGREMRVLLTELKPKPRQQRSLEELKQFKEVKFI